MKAEALMLVGIVCLVLGAALLPIVGSDATITSTLRDLPTVFWVAVFFFLGHVLWP